MVIKKMIGLMSGTSLDGLDIVLAKFEENEGDIDYTIICSNTVSYPSDLEETIKKSNELKIDEVQILDKAIGLFFAEQINSFIEQNKNTKLKRPNNWGGIEIFINQIEFWQGRKNRLHNRVLCNFQKDTWEYKLLSP